MTEVVPPRTKIESSKKLNCQGGEKVAVRDKPGPNQPLGRVDRNNLPLHPERKRNWSHQSLVSKSISPRSMTHPYLFILSYW